jgi:hypothetical protein
MASVSSSFIKINILQLRQIADMKTEFAGFSRINL